jgi:hypothetical protein
MMKRAAGVWAAALLLFGTMSTSAQQSVRAGDADVHYVVFNTMFLTPDIASQYGITRAADRALLNVSVIGPDGQPQAAEITASYRNLLGQHTSVPLKEVREAEAIYYIGAFRYTDRDTLRFRLDVRTDDGATHEVTFQQQMYLERR